MEIRFQGFTYNPGNVITHEEYIEYLLTCGDEGDFNFNDRDRIFHFYDDVDEDYDVGLLVTIKDHKKFCSLARNRIKVFESEDDDHLMDFNYFVISKNSHRGLYQHYHNSCSINQFGTFLKHRYNDMRSFKIDEKIAAEDLENNEKTIKKLERSFGAFHLAGEVQSESLQEIINEFTQLQSFGYFVYAAEEIENNFMPASHVARNVFKRVTYKSDANVGVLAESIVNYIENQGIKTGRVKGYDPEGVLRTIKLIENPDYFAKYDFDEVVDEIEGQKIDNLQENWIIQELISVAKDNDLHVPVD